MGRLLPHEARVAYAPAVATRSTARRARQMVRIQGLLQVLSEGGRATGKRRVGRFKVRRETIYRDLRALQELGYPIIGDEAGRLSHPRLDPEFRMTPRPPTVRREVATMLRSAVAVYGPGARHTPHRGSER